MSKPIPEKVMTLAEAAKFLRVPAVKLRKLAETGKVPARAVADEWRFLRSALEEWLRGRPDPNQALLQSAGMFKDDESLRQILKDIYTARGRPEDGEIAP